MRADACIRSPRPPARHGVGVLLVLVVTVLVVLLFVGLSQRQFTSALAVQAMRASIGQLEVVLAESAIEEAANQVRRAVNDPSSTTFRAVRTDVYANETGALRLLDTPAGLSRTLEMMERPAYKGFKLKEVSAQLLYQRQFEDLPYERLGLVQYRARVEFALGIGDSVVRELSVGQGFKIALVGPPRPFDQTTIYVGEGSSVTDFPAVNGKRAAYVRDISIYGLKIAAYARDPGTPAAVRDLYDQLSRRLQAVAVTASRIDEFPDGASTVFSTKTDAPLAMEESHLSRRLDEREERSLVPAKKAAERAEMRVATNRADEQAHRDFIAAVEELALVIDGLLGTIRTFHDVYRVWAGADRDVLTRFHYKMRLEHWRSKAFYRLPRSGATVPLDVQFAQLVERLGPAANGIVLVENGSGNPLVIRDRTIHGKLVVVTTGGGAVLSNVNREETDRDLLSVVALGGPIRLEGEVHAAVVCWDEGARGDGRIAATPGAQVVGMLVCLQLPGGADDRRFSVRRLAKYYSGRTTERDVSGAFPDYYYGALAPRDVYRKVSRR